MRVSLTFGAHGADGVCVGVCCGELKLWVPGALGREELGGPPSLGGGLREDALCEDAVSGRCCLEARRTITVARLSKAAAAAGRLVLNELRVDRVLLQGRGRL